MSCHQTAQYPLREGTVRQLLTLIALKGRRGSINAPTFQIHPLVKAIQKGNPGQDRENNKHEQKLWPESFALTTSHGTSTSIEETGR